MGIQSIIFAFLLSALLLTPPDIKERKEDDETYKKDLLEAIKEFESDSTQVWIPPFLL